MNLHSLVAIRSKLQKAKSLNDCHDHSVVQFGSKAVVFRFGFRFLLLNINGFDDVVWGEL